MCSHTVFPLVILLWTQWSLESPSWYISGLLENISIITSPNSHSFSLFSSCDSKQIHIRLPDHTLPHSYSPGFITAISFQPSSRSLVFSLAASNHHVFNLVNIFFNSRNSIWSFFQISSIKLYSFLFPCKHIQDYLFLFLHTELRIMVSWYVPNNYKSTTFCGLVSVICCFCLVYLGSFEWVTSFDCTQIILFEKCTCL